MHENFIELVKNVSKIANDELVTANEKYPLFQSLHEGYAVLQEEIDEAIECNHKAMMKKECMWLKIKENNTKEAIKSAQESEKYFLYSAAEMIQCIAMCRKIIESEKNYE